MSLLSHPAVVALVALFVWWFSTGIVLYVVGRTGRASRWSLLCAGTLLAAGLYGLVLSSTDVSVAGAYAAFACALLVWGTQEFAFLIGAITGRNEKACPPGCSGLRRAMLALESIVYHEIALLLSGIAVVAATWNSANQLGTWTFVILWAMRVGAKLNLFLGVPVLNQEFLPDRMKHLASFFTQTPVNPLFPVVVTISTAVTTLLVAQALASDATAFTRTGTMLLASLLALGVLEHWFMVLPLPIAALWGWSMRPRSIHPRASSGVPLSVDLGGGSVISETHDP